VPEVEKLAEKLKVKKRDRIRRVAPATPLTKVLLGREIAGSKCTQLQVVARRIKKAPKNLL
jgi:hypothetical protein